METEKLYRFLRGETTPAEEAQIEKWLEADRTEHQKEIDAVRFLFETTELYGSKAPKRRFNMNFIRSRVAKYTARVAAVLLVAAVSAFSAYRYTYDSMVDQKVLMQVPSGQQLELTLSDGTHVWLNSEATLEYPSVFARNNRSVKLTGEALFEVTRDTERPFIVETFASNVQVLGTKFNVNADEHRGRFSTTLFEGSVKLSNRLFPNQKDICLNPNEVANLTDNILYVEKTKNDDALCWTKGLLSVSDLSFMELMDKFEQVFGVKVIIERKTMPEVKNIGGKIRISSGIDNALRLLQYATDFSYEIDEEHNSVTIL